MQVMKDFFFNRTWFFVVLLFGWQKIAVCSRLCFYLSFSKNLNIRGRRAIQKKKIVASNLILLVTNIFISSLFIWICIKLSDYGCLFDCTVLVLDPIGVSKLTYSSLFHFLNSNLRKNWQFYMKQWVDIKFSIVVAVNITICESFFLQI